MEKKINDNRDGHILTELVVATMRIELNSSHVRLETSFLVEQKPPNQEIAIPFTSKREYFRYYVLENHTVFVTRQSLDMLKSLNLSV